MPAEQALTRAQKASGPSCGPGGGASRSSRARLDQTAALLAPVALIVGLALAGGGFDVSTRHIAGLARVAGRGRPAGARRGVARDGSARPLYWAVGLIGGLALLSAISSLWSGSMELSVIEADRVLVYLGFFLAAFLIAQTDERRQRFAEGMAIAVTLVALLGLASRLLPHVLDVCDSLGTGPRLRYPLGYWNANGAMCGIAIAMLLWMSRSARWTALRWLSVAAMPAVLLTLYFTYSRGGLLALVVAAGCLLALSRDRLWLLATLAIGALGALPAVLAVQARHSLADNLASQASVDQGVTVLLILLAGIAPGAAALRGACAGWRRARGRADRAGGRALAQPGGAERRRARPAPSLAIAAAIAVGGRAWHQFSSSDIQFPSQPAAALRRPLRRRPPRLLAGRDRRLRRKAAPRPRRRHLPVLLGPAALDRPAGPRRPLALPGGVRRARAWSAGCSCSAWSGPCSGAASPPGARPPSAQRERYAALFAAMLAFAVGAAFDWFWEIAGAGRGLLPRRRRRWSRRAARSSPPTRGAARPRGDGRRFGLDGRRRWPSPGSRRSPWSARCWSNARSSPARPPPPTEDIAQRRRPRRHRPLDRALGRLALRPARPARRAPGRIPGRDRALRPRDRTRGPQLAAGTTCAPGSSTRPAKPPPPRPTSKRRASSTRWPHACSGRMDLRMSAKATGDPRRRRRRPPQPDGPRARPRWRTGSGSTGPSGSRRRGALLRRLLAAGDWLAIWSPRSASPPPRPRRPTSPRSSGRCSSARPGSWC